MGYSQKVRLPSPTNSTEVKMVLQVVMAALVALVATEVLEVPVVLAVPAVPVVQKVVQVRRDRMVALEGHVVDSEEKLYLTLVSWLSL